MAIRSKKKLVLAVSVLLPVILFLVIQQVIASNETSSPMKDTGYLLTEQAETNALPIQVIPLPTTPQKLSYNSFHDLLYVAGSDGIVYIIENMSVVATVSVGTGDYAFAIDTSSGLTYITTGSGKNVAIFDGINLLGIVNFPNIVREPEFNPVDGNVYVRVNGPSNSGSTGVLNGTKLINSIQMPGSDWFYEPVANSVNGYVYAASGYGQSLQIITSAGIEESYYLGFVPLDRALVSNRQSGFTYVGGGGQDPNANLSRAAVGVYNGVSHLDTVTFPDTTSQWVCNIIAHPFNNIVYALKGSCNRDGEGYEIKVIDGSNVLTTIPITGYVPNYYNGVTINPVSGLLYVHMFSGTESSLYTYDGLSYSGTVDISALDSNSYLAMYSDTSSNLVMILGSSGVICGTTSMALVEERNVIANFELFGYPNDIAFSDEIIYLAMPSCSGQTKGVYYIHRGTDITHLVSGHILDDLGNPAPLIEVSISGGQTTLTNTSGYYEFTVYGEGPFIINPNKLFFRFAPELGVVSPPEDTTQNFIIRPFEPEPFLHLPIDTVQIEEKSDQELFFMTLTGNEKSDEYCKLGKINSWFDHLFPDYQNFMTWNGESYSVSKYFLDYLKCDTGVRCYTNHNGLDFCHNPSLPRYGEQIYAAGDGTVINTPDGIYDYGKELVIDHHNGYASLYGHLDKIDVFLNQQVSAGQKIGIMGDSGYFSSGVHLHFGVYYDKNGDGTWDESEAIDPFGWSPENQSLKDPWSTKNFYLWVYEPTSYVLDIFGGVFKSLTGLLTMEIPENAVLEEVSLEIKDIPPIGNPYNNFKFVGQDFFTTISNLVSPSSLEVVSESYLENSYEFFQPVNLIVEFFPEQMTHYDLSNLILFERNSTTNEWVALETNVNHVGKTVSAQVIQLGTFSLQAPLICSDAVNEPNDNFNTATYLADNGDPVFDNFDVESDEDWFRWPGQIGNKYQISVAVVEPFVSQVLEIYDKDGVTLLKKSRDPSFLEWQAPDSGIYFIRISREAGSVFGCDYGYTIQLRGGYKQYLPLIQR